MTTSRLPRWQAYDSPLLNMSFALGTLIVFRFVNFVACQIMLLRSWLSALSTAGFCVSAQPYW